MNPWTYYQAGVRDDPKISIGSSDIPIIIKTQRTTIKKSQRELWLEKRQIIEAWKGNHKSKMGHELEPIIIGRHISKTNGEKDAYRFKLDYILHQDFRDIERYDPPTKYKPYTEARHPQFPWAMAHADVLIIDKILIEAKTGGYFARIRRDDYDGFDISEKSILKDPDKIPIEVMLQVQWQMLCYGINKTIVLLMVDNEIYTFEIPAFSKWWPIMIEKTSKFYNCCITGEPPQPEKKEDVFDMFSSLKDKAVFVTGDKAMIAEEMKCERKKIRNMRKRLDKRIEDIDNAVVLLMGENKYLYNGETASKLFSQTLIKDQWGMIHKNNLDPEDAQKYIDKGILKKHQIRRVN